MDYGTFNPRDPSQWAQFRQEGAKGVTGINNLPYVLGGTTDVPYTWLGEPGRTNTEVQSWIYGGPGGMGGGGGGGISAGTLQQLLGLAGGGGGGGSPDFLGLGLRGGGPTFAGNGIGIMPSGDEDVSAFGLKGPRTIQT